MNEERYLNENVGDDVLVKNELERENSKVVSPSKIVIPLKDPTPITIQPSTMATTDPMQYGHPMMNMPPPMPMPIINMGNQYPPPMMAQPFMPYHPQMMHPYRPPMAPMPPMPYYGYPPMYPVPMPGPYPAPPRYMPY